METAHLNVTLLAAAGGNGSADQHDATAMFEEQLPHWLRLVYYIAGVPLSLVLICSNLVLMCAIGKCDTLATKLHIVACNVAVCDLLLGCTLMLNIGLLQQHPVLVASHGTLCTVIALAEFLPVVTAFIFLTLLHADRFLAVCVPTIYPDLWTTRRVLGICAGIWIFSVLFSAVAFAFGGEEDSLVCDILAIPRPFLLLSTLLHVLPTTTINIILFLKIKHMLKVHNCKIQVTNTLTYSNLVEDTQLARLFFMLVVLSVVAWLPLMICVILWFARVNLDTLPVAIRLCFLFGHLAGIKLLVYIAESSTYRTAIGQLFRPPKRQESSHNIRGSSGVQ